MRGALAGFTSLSPTVGQLRDYTEGAGRLKWESMTFLPGRRRHRLERRTFWTDDALWAFIDSGEYLRYDTVKVLLAGYKNQRWAEVEFYQERVVFVIDGMVVFTYHPRAC